MSHCAKFGFEFCWWFLIVCDLCALMFLGLGNVDFPSCKGWLCWGLLCAGRLSYVFDGFDWWMLLDVV